MRTVWRPQCQGRIDRGEKRHAVTPLGQLRNQHQPVVHQTFDSGHRAFAGNRCIDDGRQRIEIGPRTLLHRWRVAVLLDGCETALAGCIGRLHDIADHAARRTEVEQQRAVGRDEDFFGRYVAMQAPDGVHCSEPVEQRVQQLQELLFVGHLAEISKPFR